MLFPRYKEAGIMGINARNVDYIVRLNRRRYYPLVDDKLQTKTLALGVGIPCPELYGVIEFQSQAKDVRKMVEGKGAFVIKPAQGSGGGGILVFDEASPAGFKKASGQTVTDAELKYHLSDVLSGMYSLGGQTDKAMIEYCVQFDPSFEEIAYKGIPDIRILVFCGIPVMGMLRLPTRASDGKANLHQGGIGVGIDLATGRTLEGYGKGKWIDTHPETGCTIPGRMVPHWQDILSIASRFYGLTNLGYLGVDIVLDKYKGPMVLEANARPGIQIQVANQDGLLRRLKVAEEALPGLGDTESKVAFALERFGV
jgi:alpha-L-glutamate ligase-like protein